MNFKTKAVALGAVLALTVGATSALAAQGNRAVVVRRGVPARDLGIAPTEMKTVLFEHACRYVDTRHSTTGALQLGSTRSFQIVGGAPASQGADTSCVSSIPADASAILASVTAIPAATGDANKALGFVRLGSGSSIDNTTSLNFGGGVPQTSEVTQALCDHSHVNCGTNDISAQAYQEPSHLVVDVRGYLEKPIGGAVASDGSIDPLTASRVDTTYGVLSTHKVGTGSYAVHFNRDVDHCIAVASAQTDGLFVDVVSSPALPKFLRFDFFDTNGNPADTPFTFDVTC